MSYQTVIEGLHERFETVTALRAVLDYAPTAIHDAPLLYSILDSMTVNYEQPVTAWKYRILHSVVLRWQDFEQSELEALPLVNSIPQAVRADPHLGGRLASGMALISECQSGFREIGEGVYRVLDFYSTVVEKL